MAGPLIPLLGVVAEFIMANGARAAAMRYGPKAVEKGLKEIKNRQSAINKRVSEKRAKGEIPPRTQTAAQREARLANERARRMRGEEPRPRFDEEGFPIDEVPLQFARGDEVASGRRPGTTGPNVQRNMPGRMTGVAEKVLTGSGRPPVGTMATPRTGLLPTQTLSKMGTLSRGGLGGLVLAGGLGLFEIGRQTGFEPEKLGQAAAQVQKSLQEVANEAADVARELGQPIQDFVNRVVAGYQSEMDSGRAMSDMDGSGRTMSDMERNLMQQEQLGFAEGGAVESEIDKALEDIQSVQPEAMVIQQVMTMVMEMIQSGASEEQIVAALREMGLDDEDIQQVMMMIAEQMQGQDPIQSELSQMM